MRPPVSHNASDRSNLACTARTLRPPRSRPAPGSEGPPHWDAFCQANITWKSGVCARLRVGWISSTTCSKGMSWWCCASSARALTRASSSATVGAVGQVHAHGQRVDEEADEPLRLAPLAPRRGRADHHVLLPRQPAQHGGPARQQRHEQGGAVPQRQGLEPRRQRLVQLDPEPRAGMVHLRRTWVVRGQLQQLRGAGRASASRSPTAWRTPRPPPAAAATPRSPRTGWGARAARPRALRGRRHSARPARW